MIFHPFFVEKNVCHYMIFTQVVWMYLVNTSSYIGTFYFFVVFRIFSLPLEFIVLYLWVGLFFSQIHQVFSLWNFFKLGEYFVVFWLVPSLFLLSSLKIFLGDCQTFWILHNFFFLNFSMSVFHLPFSHLSSKPLTGCLAMFPYYHILCIYKIS